MSYIQVIGTKDSLIPPAIVLVHDKWKYMFNCGEGTTRFCIEHRLKLSNKLKNVFLTRLNWDTIGGFPEMVMAVEDKGQTSLSVYGPGKLVEYALSTQICLYRPKFTLELYELSSNKVKQSPVVFKQYEEIINKKKKKDQEEKEEEDQQLKLRIDPVLIESPAKLAAAAANNSNNNDNVSSSSSNSNRQVPFVLCLAYSKFHKAFKSPALSSSSSSKEKKKKTVASLLDDIDGIDDNIDDDDDGGGVKEDIIDDDSIYNNNLPNEDVACYICRFPDIPGKFDVQKATKLGVPKGPAFGKLMKGETVTAPNGNVVEPKDCISAPTPGPIVIIVDCPHVAYLPRLTTHEAFAPFQRGGAVSANLTALCIVHMTPLEVLRTSEYQQWMRSFGEESNAKDKVSHLIVNEELCPDRQVHTKSQIYQTKLNLVHPEMFPIPHPTSPSDVASKTTTTISTDVANHDLSWLPPRSYIADVLTKLHVLPLAKVGQMDNSDVVPWVDAVQVQEELRQKRPEAVRQCEQIMQEARKQQQHKYGNDEAELVFLGTSGACYTKYRNVSGHYLKLPGYGGIMMDVGEETYASMVRRFGKKGADEAIADLKCIFISHKHIDHMVGLMKILLVRQRIINERKRKLLFAQQQQQQKQEATEQLLRVEAERTQRRLRQQQQLLQQFSCTTCEVTFSCCSSVDMHRIIHVFKNANQTFASEQETTTTTTTTADANDNSTAAAAASSSPSNDLQQRQQQMDISPEFETLVIGPMWLETWLRDYNEVEDISSYRFVDSQDLAVTPIPKSSSLLGGSGSQQQQQGREEEPFVPPQKHVLSDYFQRELGLTDVRTVKVLHSYPSYALVLERKNKSNKNDDDIDNTNGSNDGDRKGWKFVFSGDTRPSRALIKAAKDATLVIHEATFDNTMEQKAVADNHSTINGAFAVLDAANAYRMILTHFSTRFEKSIPVLYVEQNPQNGTTNDLAMTTTTTPATTTTAATTTETTTTTTTTTTTPSSQLLNRASVAFDFMTVNWSQLEVLPAVYKAVRALMEEEEADADDDDEDDS